MGYFPSMKEINYKNLKKEEKKIIANPHIVHTPFR
jgi:hypothetical protein